jgi:hypothetical protein
MVASGDAENFEPHGIAGWLLLPALGTIVSPFLVGYTALQVIDALKDSASLSSSLHAFVWGEILFNVALVFGWIIVIERLFRHKRSYPKLYVSLCIVSLVGVLLDMLVGWRLFSIAPDANDLRDIARGVISLMIWWPYMMISRRVRNTFVEN